MSTFRVYTVSKSTRQRVGVILTGLTEAQAQSFCEAWGWSFCDEEGVSYWIDYEEENAELAKELAHIHEFLLSIIQTTNQMTQQAFGTVVCMLLEEYCKNNDLDAVEMMNNLNNIMSEVNTTMGKY